MVAHSDLAFDWLLMVGTPTNTNQPTPEVIDRPQSGSLCNQFYTAAADSFLTRVSQQLLLVSGRS